jgi:hypothetical protein
VDHYEWLKMFTEARHLGRSVQFLETFSSEEQLIRILQVRAGLRALRLCMLLTAAAGCWLLADCCCCGSPLGARAAEGSRALPGAGVGRVATPACRSPAAGGAAAACPLPLSPSPSCAAGQLSPRPTPPPILQASDIYITAYKDRITSNSGTLSMAMAAGKLVVSTPFEHAKYVVPGRGVLVPFEDPGAISEALLGLLADPHRAQQLAAAAYQYAANLNWPKVAAQYQQLFDELTTEPREAGQRQQEQPPPPPQQQRQGGLFGGVAAS